VGVIIYETIATTIHYSKQQKKPLGLSSVTSLGVSPVLSRLAINELVPGDSGGRMEFSLVNIREGIAGSRGAMVEKYWRSIWII